MRAIGAVLVATSMTISGAFADGVLAPGKPAGTKQAQIESGGVWLVVGILVAAGAIALAASTTQGNGSTTSTSSTVG